MIKIKPIQERLLKHLAIYKFLTISQCESLKIGHKSKIKLGFQELNKLEFIKFVQYATITTKKGQSERIHFLTYKGVKALLETKEFSDIDQIKFPKSSNSIFKNDYFHRISTINTQISFSLWSKNHNITPLLFERYFDKLGSARNRETTGLLHGATRMDFEDGSFYEPDGVFMYQKQDKNYLFILEVFNGNNSKRVIEQIKKSSQAIIEGLASDKYNHKAPARLLCTFELESNMKSVIENLRVDEDFQYAGIENFFFFSIAEQTWQNFDNWINLFNKTIQLSQQF